MKARAIAVLAALAAAITPAIAGAADERWEISTRMEMSGMPMRLPATTVIVCTPAGEALEERIVERDGCNVTRVKRTGNSSRFSLQCTQPQELKGEGTITREAEDAYRGEFSVTGRIDGREVSMKSTYSARRLGVCEVKGQAAPAGPRGGRVSDVADSVVPLNELHLEGFDMNDPTVLEGLRRLQQHLGESP